MGFYKSYNFFQALKRPTIRDLIDNSEPSFNLAKYHTMTPLLACIYAFCYSLFALTMIMRS